MLRAFLFDLDGVIVDTAKYHFLAWRRMANEIGFDFTAEQNEQLKGVGRRESLEIILGWGGIELGEAEKEQWMARKNEWYLEYVGQMGPEEVLPGARAFLESALAAGIKVGLGSASKNARLILDRTGLTSLFDTIVDGNRALRTKPDPEVFLLGAADLGVSPSEAVVFEDAAKGIEAAVRGGFHTVGIGSAEVLSDAERVAVGLSDLTVEEVVFAFADI
jgi:beta-phosphoglucomutase